MVYKRPIAGDPARDLVLSARYQSHVVDVVNRYLRGALNQAGDVPDGIASVSIANDASDFQESELVALTIDSGVTDEQLVFAKNPVIHAVEPTWHGNIGQLVVLSESLAEGDVIGMPVRTSGVVRVTSADTSKLWLMPDPDNPRRMKAATGGIFRVLVWVGDFAVGDFTQNQPLWRYELTQDSNGATSTTGAKLIELDDTVFSTSIDLSDPEGVTEGYASGSTGFCIHAGNEFIAIGGGCSGNEIDVVTDVILTSDKLCFCRKRVVVCSETDLPQKCITIRPCPTTN